MKYQYRLRAREPYAEPTLAENRMLKNPARHRFEKNCAGKFGKAINADRRPDHKTDILDEAMEVFVALAEFISACPRIHAAIFPRETAT